MKDVTKLATDSLETLSYSFQIRYQNRTILTDTITAGIIGSDTEHCTKFDNLHDEDSKQLTGF